MKITQAESVISVWNGHVPFDTRVPPRVFGWKWKIDGHVQTWRFSVGGLEHECMKLTTEE